MMVFFGKSYDIWDVEVLIFCLFGGIVVGFYIVWGCLVWVLFVYMLLVLYFVNYFVEFGIFVYILILFVICYYL